MRQGLVTMKNPIGILAFILFIAAWLVLAPQSEAAPQRNLDRSGLPDRLSSNLAARCSASYTVQAGDTASKIATRCGVSLSALRSANGLGVKSVLWVGQRLIIPGGSGRSSGSSSLVGCPNPYPVHYGETISSIAYRCGTTVANLRRWNGLSSNAVHAGQFLITRGYATPPSIKPPASSLPRKAPGSSPAPSPTPRIEPPVAP
jgi:LysM repeat protein